MIPQTRTIGGESPLMLTGSGLARGGLQYAGLSQTVEPRMYLSVGLLALGSEGEPVREVQADLNLLGFNAGPEDGIFGPDTESAVRTFQGVAAPIVRDGIVGPDTKAKLAEFLLAERDIEIVPADINGGGEGEMSQPTYNVQDAGLRWNTVLSVVGIATAIGFIVYGLNE